MGAEVVVAVQEVQLHKVEGSSQALLEWAPLSVQRTDAEVRVTVGKTSWVLLESMPTLQVNLHTYMLAIPDTQLFYSVLLAQNTPDDVAQLFAEVLHACTAFEVGGALSKQQSDAITEKVAEYLEHDDDIVRQPRPEYGGAAELVAQQQQTPYDQQLQAQQGQGSYGRQSSMAERIGAGAERAKAAIGQGAMYASGKIAQAGEALQQRYAPNQQPMQLSPATQQTLRRCRQATHTAATAAAAVTGKFADISVRVAEGIVTRMSGSNYGQKLQSDQAPTRMGAAREVAAASVAAAAGIYESLYAGGMTVLQSSGNETSNFIGHKYGPQAHEAAKDVTQTAIDGGTAYYSMSRMGVKAVARRIAKKTAKGLVINAVAGQKQQGRGAAAAVQAQAERPAVQHGGQAPQIGKAM